MRTKGILSSGINLGYASQVFTNIERTGIKIDRITHAQGGLKNPIRPVTDLGDNLLEIEKILNLRTPVKLTEWGSGAMAVLRLKEYAGLTDSIELKYDEADRQADITEERLSHETVFSNMKSAGQEK